MYNVIKQIIKYIRKEKEHNKIETFCIGINSTINTEKSRHCLLLDYDIKDLPFIIKDIKQLISHFNLANIDIWETKNGYHAMGWYEDMPYSRLRQIIDYSSCDTMFKYIGRFYDKKTLRCSGKHKSFDIKYVKTILGKRIPTTEELEIGNLKKQEYLALQKMHDMINPEVLKDEKKQQSQL
jgi:hypothetical protein